MDKVRSIMEKGKEVVRQGREQELFQGHGYSKSESPDTNAIAEAEWKQFLKSAYYRAVVPTGYLEVDRLQNDPTFCLQTNVHRLDTETRIAILMKQFNSYMGNSGRNQLLPTDLVYYRLAQETFEVETWRGIHNFPQVEASYANQLPNLTNQHSDVALGTVSAEEFDNRKPYECRGTSARLSRAPTFGSSTASDREWTNGVILGYLNVSEEWLVDDPVNTPPESFIGVPSAPPNSPTDVPRTPPNSPASSSSSSIISNCPALINHEHSCTAPSDVLPASPALNARPAPAPTGIIYDGPNPSAALDQRLDDHVDAPIIVEEMEFEDIRRRNADLELRIIVSFVIFVFCIGCVAAIIAAITFGTKKECIGFHDCI
ncbi:hypothetical protein NHQ30_008949 [Ciborinia camelliae]|nr:hypothetical protein NHQ30_008949 [Ciborinia camelliae]